MGFIGHKLTLVIPISPEAEPNLKEGITAVIMGAYIGSKMWVGCDSHLDWGDFSYTDEGVTMVLSGDPEGLVEVPDMVAEVLGELFSGITGSWAITIGDWSGGPHPDKAYEQSSNGTF